MKIFTILLFIFCYISLSAQQIFPTHEQNPVWNMESTSIWPGMDDAYSLETTDEIELCGVQWTPVHQFDSTGLDEGIVIYYRQQGQKVYYRTTTNCEVPDYLMYDFSLEQGDTLTIRLEYGQYDIPVDVLFTVLIVGTELINGVEYKRLWVQFQFTTFNTWHLGLTKWVEGIGDITFNPFYPITCFGVDCQNRDHLQCLTTNEDVLYSPYSGFCSGVNDLQRWHVDQNSPSAPGDGSDWENAFATLQSALDFAGPGDTIWVAAGTYFPEKKIPGNVFGGNADKTFVLNQGIAVFGGFQGNEFSLEERNWEANPTILSGNLNEETDSTDNAFHVLYTLGTDSTTVLDGFIIQDGYAISDENEMDNKGGGILVNTDVAHPNASPTIRNCHFRHNTAQYGGGIFCRGRESFFANPKIENCVFEFNHSTFHGAAIYKEGQAAENAPMQIRDCLFENNKAGRRGGAIYFFDMINLLNIHNCDFIHNYSLVEGGGICMEYTTGQGQVIVDSSSFIGNDANSGGGFFFYYSGNNQMYDNEYAFDFNSCMFHGNKGRADTGGAIEIAALGNIVNLNIYDCSFYGNNSAFHGGGLHMFIDGGSQTYLKIDKSFFENNFNFIGAGGAIACRGFGGGDNIQITNKMTLTNSLFYNNTGALSYVSGYPGAFDGLLKNCTFRKNGPYVISKNSGPDFNYINFYNKLEISNSIVWEPERPLNRIFYNGAPENVNLYDYNINHCLISAEACDITGGWEACGETNLFNLDPLFLEEENGNFHVAACSPAINSGQNSGLDTLGMTTDLDENDRILEDHVDIGAFERLIYTVNPETINNVSCAEANDGIVSFFSSGEAPFSYYWENGNENGNNIDQLGPGFYFFTVTDANNCEAMTEIGISAPAPITVYSTALPTTGENVSNGSIFIDSISGGMAPYYIQWSTGDTTENLNTLLPGEYIVTITDANSCEIVESYSVNFVDGLYEPQSIRNQFSLAPNPSTAGTSIQIDYHFIEKGNWKIELFDLNGKRLLALTLVFRQEQGNFLIENVSSLTSGVYSLLFTAPTGARKILKWVVI